MPKRSGYYIISFNDKTTEWEQEWLLSYYIRPPRDVWMFLDIKRDWIQYNKTPARWAPLPEPEEDLI